MPHFHFKPTDARGWIGIGIYVLVLLILGMIWFDRTLLRDDYFKTICTLIISTGFINGPVGWAYQATKAGGEMAESSARIAEQAASAAVGAPVVSDTPQPVVVTNAPDDPVPTTAGAT